MKSRSISFKVGVTFGFLILVFVTMGVFEVIRLGRLIEDLRAAMERSWAKAELAREAVAYSNQSNRISLEVFLLDSQEEIESLLVQRAEYTEKITKLLKRLETQADSAFENELISGVVSARASYTASYKSSLDLLVKQRQMAEARSAMVEKTLPLLNTYHEQWNAFVEFEGAELNREAKRAEANYLEERKHLLLLIAIAGIIAGSGAIHVTKSEMSLNTSRDQLEARIVGLNLELEKKVTRRTAELAEANRELVTELAENEKMKEALVSAHAETEQLISSISSILIGVDDQGQVKRWNSAATTTFAIRPENALERPFDQLEIRWHQSAVAEMMASAARLGKSKRLEDLEFLDAEGVSKSLGATVHPILGEQGKYCGFVLLGVDISQRKQMQEQLRQAQKLEAIGQLAAGIAHEINTPIQYVGDNVGFLQENWEKTVPLVTLLGQLWESSDENLISPDFSAELHAVAADVKVDYLLKEVPKALAQSMDGVERVSQIVKAMREFSHRGSPEKSPSDVNRAIQAAITVSRNEWKYVAEVKSDLDPALPLVECVVGEIQQVFLNLLINAAHAIAEKSGSQPTEKGAIYVSTRTAEEEVEIRVEDTGAGIPEEIRSRVFEPFFTTKPVGKGTGQGLTLAYAVIVKTHGGRIWIDSPPGKGATVIIRLPLKVQANG